jgi:hypothetical protein
MNTKVAAAANEQFQFIPPALADHCRRLIESYHAIHGYAALPDILWRAEVSRFVESQDDLRQAFRKASTTRSARDANSSFVLLACTLLSLEILASDFLGWGHKFPAAKRAAGLLLAQLSPARRRLKDVYLSQPNHRAWVSHPELAIGNGSQTAGANMTKGAIGRGRKQPAPSRRNGRARSAAAV